MGTPVIHRGIKVFSCVNDPSAPAVALIDGFPLIFRGATPMQAKRNADEWRRKATADDKLIPSNLKREWLGEA